MLNWHQSYALKAGSTVGSSAISLQASPEVSKGYRDIAEPSVVAACSLQTLQFSHRTIEAPYGLNVQLDTQGTNSNYLARCVDMN